MDPISEVLRDLTWSVRALGRHHLRPRARRSDQGLETSFHVVLDGAIDLTADGTTTRLERGAFALLMTDSPRTVIADSITGAHVLSGTMSVDGFAALGGVNPRMIIACQLLEQDPLVLPLLEAMEAELTAGRVGSASVVGHLANVVGATAMRAWLESGCPVAGEWLAPVRDPHLGRAIAAIHRDPGTAWTVAGLARVAQASRSAFADRFTAAVGEPPARYVVRVRMQRAKVLLRRDGLTVGQAAEQLGYSSDAAFSRAFRRFDGRSPREWRRQAA